MMYANFYLLISDLIFSLTELQLIHYDLMLIFESMENKKARKSQDLRAFSPI